MGRSIMITLTKIMKDNGYNCSQKNKTGLFPCVPSSDIWQLKLDMA